jgi:regulatory protein
MAVIMKIISIRQFKGNIYKIELDGGKTLCLTDKTVSEYNMAPGSDISESEIESIKRESLFKRAKERALTLLDIKDYGYIGLYKKLEADYPEDVCHDVCLRMSELGLIDDRRFAGKMAYKLFETKLLGIYNAKMEMRLKDIPDEIIEEVIEPYSSPEAVKERLTKLIEKKYSSRLTDEKSFEKVKAALSRAGYCRSDINECLEDFL